MDETRFWAIIAATGPGAGLEEQGERLASELESLSTEDLVAFEQRLQDVSSRLYTWQHWGAAEVMLGGCSDDVFMDFRTWVIAQGREVFERFLADPDSLADAGLEDEEEVGEAELFAYVASEVYEERTGNEIYDALPDGAGAEDDEPRGERFDGSDLAGLESRYPRLYAAYGGNERIADVLGRRFQWPKKLQRNGD